MYVVFVDVPYIIVISLTFPHLTFHVMGCFDNKLENIQLVRYSMTDGDLEMS